MATTNIPQGGGVGGNANFQNYALGIPRSHRPPNAGAPSGIPQVPTQGGTFTSFSKFNTKLYQKHLQAVEAAKNASGDGTFDGKQLRKSVYRKTIDYNSSVVKYLQNRIWMRDSRDRRAIQPDNLYHSEVRYKLSSLLGILPFAYIVGKTAIRKRVEVTRGRFND